MLVAILFSECDVEPGFFDGVVADGLLPNLQRIAFHDCDVVLCAPAVLRYVEDAVQKARDAGRPVILRDISATWETQGTSEPSLYDQQFTEDVAKRIAELLVSSASANGPLV